MEGRGVGHALGRGLRCLGEFDWHSSLPAMVFTKSEPRSGFSSRRRRLLLLLRGAGKGAWALVNLQLALKDLGRGGRGRLCEKPLRLLDKL